MTPEELTAVIEANLAATSTQELVTKLVISAAIILALLLLQRGAQRLPFRQRLQPEQRYRWNKITRYVAFALGAFLVGAVWWEGLSGLATIVGLALAGLAVALREPIASLGGWAYILGRKPFELGDRISIDIARGDVADIGPLMFSLLEVGDGQMGARQLTGKTIQVPNSYVFTKVIANESRNFRFIWHEVPVVVTFESDWRKAKQILQSVLQRHVLDLVPEAHEQLQNAAEKMIFAGGSPEPVVYTRVVDIGVELTMRFVAEIRRPRQMEEALWEDVLAAFAAEPDIDFAYPTTRFYNNQAEGKPGTGGPPADQASPMAG